LHEVGGIADGAELSNCELDTVPAADMHVIVSAARLANAGVGAVRDGKADDCNCRNDNALYRHEVSFGVWRIHR
jgi:hypothetical protein